MIETSEHSAPSEVSPRADQASAPAVALSDVVKRWRPGLPPVLDGASLDVAAGTVVAVTGRNGAGKTTLLRIISGLLAPDAGTVTVCGLHSRRQRTEFNRRIGFLLAGNTGLYARLNVGQHLELWARLALMPRPQRAAAIAEVSGMFGLQEIGGLRADRLSMGQRQRLRIAMTFLHRPEVVLLDEPYTSLDPEALAMLRAAVQRFQARGGAGIVCSPEPEPAKLGHDRCYVLEGGRLMELP